MKTVIAVLLVVAAFFLLPIVKQDEGYHNFADKRWHNLFDVMSNLIFLLVGMHGLYSYKVFYNSINRYWLRALYYIGVILTCFGSSYYHYNPNSETLVYDRLPMTIAFTTLLAVIMETFIHSRLWQSRRLTNMAQIGMILFGIMSVAVWVLTEDLKLYGLVQFGSILYVIYDLIVNSEYQKKDMVIGISLYLVAKLFEHFDHQVFYMTDCFVSGHTLKHLAAGIGAFYSGRCMMSIPTVAKRISFYV
jgi:hypothetical protein